eukprot:534860-Amphidinium_carterae.1
MRSLCGHHHWSQGLKFEPRRGVKTIGMIVAMRLEWSKEGSIMPFLVLAASFEDIIFYSNCLASSSSSS